MAAIFQFGVGDQTVPWVVHCLASIAFMQLLNLTSRFTVHKQTAHGSLEGSQISMHHLYADLRSNKTACWVQSLTSVYATKTATLPPHVLRCNATCLWRTKQNGCCGMTRCRELSDNNKFPGRWQHDKQIKTSMSPTMMKDGFM